jgi:hypothetical protein
MKVTTLTPTPVKYKPRFFPFTNNAKYTFVFSQNALDVSGNAVLSIVSTADGFVISISTAVPFSIWSILET